MINLERVKLGQVYLGRPQRGTDGRRYQPLLIVIDVDTEKGHVVVKNERGESQIMDPKNLFTIQGTLRFLRQQIFDARRRN